MAITNYVKTMMDAKRSAVVIEPERSTVEYRDRNLRREGVDGNSKKRVATY